MLEKRPALMSHLSREHTHTELLDVVSAAFVERPAPARLLHWLRQSRHYSLKSIQGAKRATRLALGVAALRL